jgi:hypothetical protein
MVAGFALYVCANDGIEQSRQARRQTLPVFACAGKAARFSSTRVAAARGRHLPDTGKIRAASAGNRTARTKQICLGRYLKFILYYQNVTKRKMRPSFSGRERGNAGGL